MKPKLIRASTVFCLLAGMLLGAPAPGAKAADDPLKLQAVLVWGTNAKSSPDPAHKRVEPFILKKLQELPLKWTNYFEVNRKSISAGTSAPVRTVLSDKCEVEVKNVGKSSVEVCLVGKGAPVLKRTQALPKGKALVLGGDAPNETAWLVVLVREE
jgi:hypothetical protein